MWSASYFFFELKIFGIIFVSNISFSFNFFEHFYTQVLAVWVSFFLRNCCLLLFIPIFSLFCFSWKWFKIANLKFQMSFSVSTYIFFFFLRSIFLISWFISYLLIIEFKIFCFWIAIKYLKYKYLVAKNLWESCWFKLLSLSFKLFVQMNKGNLLSFGLLKFLICFCSNFGCEVWE